MSAAKPLNLSKKHYTKKEIEKKKKAEEKLKGNNDLVYKVPKQLRSNKEKELYSLMVEELRPSNILNNLDINMLIQTVNALIQMEEAKRLIKLHGQVIVKEDGSLQKNPAITIYKDFYSIFYQCSTALGLNPTSRSKLATLNQEEAEEANDELKKILSGK